MSWCERHQRQRAGFGSEYSRNSLAVVRKSLQLVSRQWPVDRNLSEGVVPLCLYDAQRGPHRQVRSRLLQELYAFHEPHPSLEGNCCRRSEEHTSELPSLMRISY